MAKIVTIGGAPAFVSDRAMGIQQFLAMETPPHRQRHLRRQMTRLKASGVIAFSRGCARSRSSTKPRGRRADAGWPLRRAAAPAMPGRVVSPASSCSVCGTR